jgi:hypothetical protein
MSTDEPTSKIIVIDTLGYAGNDERELCAYLTGEYGDCQVGDNIAQKYGKDIEHRAWWKEHISPEPDDNDTYRPASPYATPGWFNNGMGGMFRDLPENEEPARLARIQATKDYYQPRIDAIQKRLDEQDWSHGWTKEACERQISIHKNTLGDAEFAMLTKYDAEMSVAIYVDEFPPVEVLDELIARAEEYARDPNVVSGKEWDSVMEITGYRKIDPTTGFEEEFTQTNKSTFSR